MNRALTPRQEVVYGYIRDYLQRKGVSPTLEELRKHIGVKALNTVVQHLVALEKKGYIVRHKHAKRNIQLRNEVSGGAESTTAIIPVLASVGCDDLSTLANENYDEFLEMDRSLFPRTGKFVALRAVGTSMNDADIDDGDYVLVEITEHVKDGDRVAVIVDDMATIKKLERKNGMIILRPESKDKKYKPIVLNGNFKIFGKVLLTIPGESMDVSRVEPLSMNSTY